MKFFLVLLFFMPCIASNAQQHSQATFNLVYPEGLVYDTLLVKNSEGHALSETSTKKRGSFIVKTYLLNMDSLTVSSFSIYFGGSSSAVNDTLYFSGRGRDLLVEIKDSFALRNRINFKLKNVYNFEDLYKRYTQYCNSQTKKYDSMKDPQEKKLSIQQYTLKAGLDFVKQNVANPYTGDLFSVFVISNPLAPITYGEAHSFYLKYMKKNIIDRRGREFVENKIDALQRTLNEGEKAPSFSARSIDNKLVNSDSLLGKNVLLTFWATWCPPCVAEFPGLKEINKEYKGDNFIMVSVSLDGDSTKMANMITQKKLDWVQIFNSKPMLDSFRINPIPALFFIDENGTILYNNGMSEDAANYLARLKMLLKKKFKH